MGVARCLADGMTPGQIAEAMGMEEQRVSILLEDERVLEAYRSELRHRAMAFYAQAVNQAGAMLCSDNAATLQKAIHEALDAFEETARDGGEREITVRVEGIRPPGMPLPPEKEEKTPETVHP